MKHVREVARPLPADTPPAVRVIVERALAKDPAARWPSAAALAAVARQAASTLAAQPQMARAAAKPSSPAAGPVSGAPTSPAVTPTGNRVSPSPYPTRAVVPPASTAPPHGQSSATPAAHNRGAAQVPPTRPRQEPVYGYARPPAPATVTGDTTSRSLLIVLAVILGVLVLLCAGVISYLVRSNNTALAPISPGARLVTTVSQVSVERDDSPRPPYRRVELALPAGTVTTR
jgi:serine/threonine-protein kinase